MTRLNKINSMCLLLLCTLLLVGGCQNNKTKQTQSNASEKNNESQYPIKIKNKFGTTVIKQKPQRVVTIQWGNQDIPLALGVEPVGFSAANFGVKDESGLLPWTKKQLKKIGAKKPNVFRDTDGLDFEAIADARPDVILAAYSGITKEEYQKLSKIAPVVAYPKSAWTTSWKQQVRLNAQGMGKAKQGERLIAKTQQKITQAVKKYPQLKNKTVTWVNFSAQDLSKFQIYTPADPRPALLREFGLQYPQSLTQEIKKQDAYSKDFSAERADVLDQTDIIVGYGDQKLYAALKKDPVLGKIPAIKRGSVAFIDSDSPIVAAGTPTPLSIDYTLTEYLSLLGKAAGKVQ